MTTSDLAGAEVSATARSILESGVSDLGERLRTAAVLDEAHHALAGVGSSLWKGAYDELTRLVQGFLEFEIGEVLLAGWGKYNELKEAGQATRGTQESAVVDLAGRDLTLVRHPRVDVVLLGQKLPSLTFDLRVEVKVIAAAGTVRDGALVGLSSGRCDVTVILSLGESELAKETRTLDPRATVTLTEPIPLTSVDPGSTTAGDQPISPG